MSKQTKHKQNQGFTLLETLLTVAIVVILLGVSAVGVAYYKDYLKITELDNTARDIYMAAENRAVLLQNSGQLRASAVPLSEGSGSSLTLTLSGSGSQVVINTPMSSSVNEDELKDLLPKGTIDPALWSGDFRVVYDQATGHVEEVFYAKETFTEDLDLFRKSRGDRVTGFRNGSTKRLVGWYSGGEAENIGTKPLPTPGVEVLIDNGDELTLTVVYTMPEGLPAGVTVTFEPSVELLYGGTKIDLLTSPRTPDVNGTFSSTPGAKVTKVTYKWVLDSLESGKQFKGLVSGDLGGDFTVTAGLTLKAAGYIESAYYAQDTDNSLFAKETHNETTAYIANVRHLQNLHLAHSNAASSIEKAEQLCDVDCKGGTYNFIPIANGALGSYNGHQKTISGLYVSCPGDAGLFGLVTKAIIFEQIRLLAPQVTSTGPDEAIESNAAPLLARVDEENCTLKDIEVIDGSADGKTYAGGLVGLINGGASCSLENCRVYWNTPGDLLEGSSNKQVRYVISGNCAGGLIGLASGAAEIKNSFAATTVKGTASSGGLAGQTNSLTVSHSYADCYLAGSGQIGGLAGQGALDLTSCYAAGFIVAPPEAAATAGLTNGNATASGGVYSVVRVMDGAGELSAPGTLLADNLEDNGTNVRYLKTAAETFSGTTGFVQNPETHVYNVAHKLHPALEQLTPPYIFRGLTDLPHYGDWAELEEPETPSSLDLVYYEKYDDGTYGFHSNGGIDTLRKDTKNPVVLSDGYALAIKAEGSLSGKTTPMTYGDTSWTLKQTGPNWHWKPTTGGGSEMKVDVIENAGDYTLLLLPVEIVTGPLSKEDTFYQKLVLGEGQDAVTYWFNPHFAKSVHTGEAEPVSPANASHPAYVRTPRHFYDLSRFQDSYVNGGKAYYFRQELDLDYGTYTGLFAMDGKNEIKVTGLPFKQGPIGYADDFSGTYDGDYHTIRNVFVHTPGGKTKEIGLFGLSNGTLKNIIYRVDPKTGYTLEMGSGAQSFGALLGGNSGTVENCAVYGAKIMAKPSILYSYTGGLVGQNEGEIRNCSAEVMLSTEGSSSSYYSGGLVGMNNGGTISSCYAVGTVTVPDGANSHASGLVGSNSGKIQNSYAAARLEGGTTCGLAMGGAADNSYYLKGLFRYRGEEYMVDEAYNPAGNAGEPIIPALLAKEPSALPQAQRTVHDDISTESWRADYLGDGRETFPYGTGVTDGLGDSIHYGLWPVDAHVELVYYEQYQDGYGLRFSGESDYNLALEKLALREDTDNPVVRKDGYALAAKLDLDRAVVYYGGDDASKQQWRLTHNLNGVWHWERIDGTSTEDCAPLSAGEGREGYTLFPLPTEVIAWALPTASAQDFHTQYYQKLFLHPNVYAPNPDRPSKTYWFNPHFASPVTETEEKPAVTVKNPIPVRTARHLYNLSSQVIGTSKCYSGFFGGRLYYKQELDLDYGTYDGYAGIFAPGAGELPFKQDPIGLDGSAAQCFAHSYDGGYHIIRNVFYNTPGSADKYCGLFGYVGHDSLPWRASLKNIVFAMDPQKQQTVRSDGASKNVFYVGSLVGMAHEANITNCSAYGVNLKSTKGHPSLNPATGGLIGAINDALVQNCSVEAAALSDNFELTAGRTGGMIGCETNDSTSSSIESCYAVGKVRTGTDAYQGGLIGYVQTSAKNSYAAVWIDRGSDALTQYGFSDGNSAAIDNCFWLKESSSLTKKDFSYRGASYNTYSYTGGAGSRASAASIESLMTNEKMKKAGMVPAEQTVYADEGDFPYLTGVTGLQRGRNGEILSRELVPTHYGLWPIKKN